MLMNPKHKKSTLAIALVLIVGLLLGAAILRSGKAGPATAEAEHGHEHAEGEHGDEHDDKDAAPAKPASVEISDAQLQRSGIAIAEAGPARIRSTLQLLGEVRLNQDRTVIVTPRLAGSVEAVYVSAGERVQRGQVLAVIASQALADQRSELLAATQRMALAKTTYEREKRLWEDKISAEQDYLAARQAFQEAEITAESARQKLAALGVVGIGGSASTQGLTRYEIRAPIAGVVTDKQISVGEVLKEDAAIFQIADLSTLWVELSVPAGVVNRLTVGDAASVEAAGVATEAKAKLVHIGALVGEQSRNATARLLLPNPKGQWRPGLPVSVALLSADADGEVAVAVAVDAVQKLGTASVVFGREGQQFEARPLQLGRSDGRFVEVLGGLSAGERYAAKNSYLIKADMAKAGAGHAH